VERKAGKHPWEANEQWVKAAASGSADNGVANGHDEGDPRNKSSHGLNHTAISLVQPHSGRRQVSSYGVSQGLVLLLSKRDVPERVA
jgi:hypothetical protein